MRRAKNPYKPGFGAAFRIGLVGIVFCSHSALLVAQWATSGNDIYTSLSGNVGIGSTFPDAKLDVNGGLVIKGANTAGTGLTLSSESGYKMIQSWNGQNLFLNPQGNYVVIGSLPSAPSAKLQLSVGSGDVGFAMSAGNLLRWRNGLDNGFAAAITGNIGRQGSLELSATENSFMRFYVGAAANAPLNSAFERMRIETNGTVGIGTTSPDQSYKLHVAGAVRVDGNIAAKYQDVAEWVSAPTHLVAGTVVVVDPGSENGVQASAKAYDTAVAGVISEQPGLILGEEGQGKVLVSTMGRVKVRVDASKGPIQAGDLLVSSEIEGFAMRSEPLDLGGTRIHRPGTLIGKALQPLAEGQGEILVLLSLQ